MTPRRLSIYFLLMTVVIDAMGIGIIMPVMPDLIRDLLDTNLSQAAVWGGILSSSFAVMQFLFGAAVGNLSDRYGRRPVLLGSLFVVAVDYVIMGLTNSIWVLLLGRVIGGIASATQSTANAYMADISKPEEKAQNFGLIGAAFGVGFILGPVLGGLLGEFGPRAPFYAAAVLATINLVFGAIILSETVTPDRQRPLQWRRANPFRALKHVGSMPGLGLLLIMLLFHQLAFYIYPSMWSFYLQEKFSWTALQVGWSFAAFGFLMAAVQGGLIRVIIPYLGDRKSVLMGLVVSTIALFAYGFAWNGWIICILIPLSSLGFVMMPALTSIMSRAVSDNMQGELQGVLTSVGAIAAVISPLAMTNVFRYFTAPTAPIYLPSAPFFLAGALEVIALALFIQTFRSLPKRKSAEDLG